MAPPAHDHPAPLARTHVVVASADVVMRHGLHCMVDTVTRKLGVAEAATVSDAVRITERLHPRVVLLDTGREPGETIAALPSLVQRSRVVLITRRPDQELAKVARRLGVTSVLVYDDITEDELAHTLDAAFGADEATVVSLPASAWSGHQRSRSADRHAPAEVVRLRDRRPPSAVLERLSPREGEVMHLIARGLRNGDIATTLGMSEKTVKNHINRIFAKLHVDTRAQAILLWLG